jgi:hypothetical protein
MGLPSQDRSGELGRSYVYKNKGLTKGPTPIILAAVAGVAVIVGGIWAFSKLKGEGGIAEPSAANADITTPALKTDTKPVVKTEPTTISQGPGGGSSLSATLAQAAQPSTSPSPSPSTQPTATPAAPSATPMTVPGSTPSGTPASTPSSAQPAPSQTPATTITPAGETGKPAPVDLSRPNPNDVKTTPSGSPNLGTPGIPPTSGTPGTAGGNQGVAGGGLAPSGSTDEVHGLIGEGDRKLQANDLVGARAIYSKALMHRNIVKSDADVLRSKLGTINDDLIFSSKIAPGDKIVESYSVQSGDNLVKIAKKRELVTDWRLIQRINKADPARLSVGQKLKLVRGPFHVVVHKSDYRLDLFQGSPDDQDSWTFIKSFKVGLGTNNGTPVGNFVVKKNSKLVNPPWVNPQTGQKFAADDPKNPIGERWLGIEGVGESKIYTGFGIHGTVEPDSIGQQRSMGCVRLGKEDVELVYEMLVEQISVVKILP